MKSKNSKIETIKFEVKSKRDNVCIDDIEVSKLYETLSKCKVKLEITGNEEFMQDLIAFLGEHNAWLITKMVKV